MKCPATLETAKGVLHCQRSQTKRSLPHERHEWRGSLAGKRWQVDGMGVSHAANEPQAAEGKEAVMMIAWMARISDDWRQGGW